MKPPFSTCQRSAHPRSPNAGSVNLLCALLLTCVSLIWPVDATGQDYVEWSTEVRTSLGFRVNEAAIGSLLPDGWRVNPIAGAPDMVNLSLTFMDRLLVLDPQGQPVRSGSSRYMVMSVRRQSSVVIRSGSRPEYTRTYRIDQASDALGTPADPDSRLEEVSFIPTGPLFSRIFDGTEVLTGVTAIPWYSREIFVP